MYSLFFSQLFTGCSHFVDKWKFFLYRLICLSISRLISPAIICLAFQSPCRPSIASSVGMTGKAAKGAAVSICYSLRMKAFTVSTASRQFSFVFSL